VLVGWMNKVIIVDDEPLVLKVAQKLLQKLNFDVVALDSEKSVTEELQKSHNQQKPISFALVDLNIPGTDVAKMIRNILEKQPKVKIIITTGSVAEDINNYLGQATPHYDAVLIKPYSLNELKSILSSLGFSHENK
jgi:CheY-like chemotaxis protein